MDFEKTNCNALYLDHKVHLIMIFDIISSIFICSNRRKICYQQSFSLFHSSFYHWSKTWQEANLFYQQTSFALRFWNAFHGEPVTSNSLSQYRNKTLLNQQTLSQCLVFSMDLVGRGVFMFFDIFIRLLNVLCCVFTFDGLGIDKNSFCQVSSTLSFCYCIHSPC